MAATIPSGVCQRISDRLDWAWKHIEKANEVVELWGKEDPYRVDGEFDADTGYYSFRLRAVKPIAPELGLIVADAVHNLRSALDNTMWALRDPAVTDDRILRHISFFCANRDPILGGQQWKSWAGRVQTAISKDILDDLHDLQLYRGFNRIRDAFAGLDALWQASKHRIPTFGLSQQITNAVVVFPKGNMDIYGRPGPFEEGDEIAEGRPHPGPKPEFEPHFTMQIAFERGGPCPGVPVTDGLLDLYQLTRQEILPRFLARL